jgi:hypothetical protein
MRCEQRVRSFRSRTLGTTCALLVLIMPVPLRAQRSADFGQRWARTHPLGSEELMVAQKRCFSGSASFRLSRLSDLLPFFGAARRIHAPFADAGHVSCFRANPPDTILACGGEVQICFGQHRKETFSGSGCNGRRHDQEEDRQGLWVYRHWGWRGHVFSLGKLRRELRRSPGRTTSVIYRRKWTKRAKSRKRQAGLRLKRFKAREADEFSSAFCVVSGTPINDKYTIEVSVR